MGAGKKNGVNRPAGQADATRLRVGANDGEVASGYRMHWQCQAALTIGGERKVVAGWVTL